MEDFIGIFYPPDDVVEYTFVDKQGNVVTSYWWDPGVKVDHIFDTERLNDLGPGWVEIGTVSEEDLVDPTPQTDYHAPPMLYTGPLTVTPTGKFRIRPEDVTGICGRAD